MARKTKLNIAFIRAHKPCPPYNSTLASPPENISVSFSHLTSSYHIDPLGLYIVTCSPECHQVDSVSVPSHFNWSLQTNIHAPGGIRTRNLLKRAASDTYCRTRGHWNLVALH